MLDPQRESDDLRPALAAGDEAAFGELLDRVGPRLHRAATRMLGCRDDADDAIQEVFVSLVRSKKRLRDIENLSAYLFVMLHHAVGRSIKNRQKQAVPLAHPEDHAAPGRHGPGVDEELLNRAIQSLPADQREVVVLRADGGLTFAEIGALQNVNANTVASRYRYALEKLRSQLRKAPC